MKINIKLFTCINCITIFMATVSCTTFTDTQVSTGGVSFKNDGVPLLVPASPEHGFNYPYFLFVPQGVSRNEPAHLLFVPNNSGQLSETLEDEIAIARQRVTIGSGSRWLAMELGVPLVVPVFPRSKDLPLVYTHELDRDTMLTREGKLKRLDLQTLAMIEHAKQRLLESGIAIKDRVLMHGYSAAGSFVNRFVLMHPDMVRVATYGGVAGLPILPVPELDGVPLPYPIGIADFQRVTGKPFDEAAYALVPQFAFMGQIEENDSFPFDDAFTDWERAIITAIGGREMIPARWELAQQIIRPIAPRLQFMTYAATRHEIRPEMWRDIAEFLRQNSDGSFRPIEPFEYPSNPADWEVRVAEVTAVTWATQKALLPEWCRGLPRPENAIVVRTNLGNDPVALVNHNKAAGFEFTLRAPGAPDVQLKPEHRIGNCTGGVYGAHFVRLDDQTLAEIQPGIEYTLHPANSDPVYRWLVAEDVRLIRPEQ